MLTTLRALLPDLAYGAFVLTVLLTIFWRPIIGVYFLTPLIPAEEFRERLAGYPLGGSMITILLLAIAIGLLRSGRSINTPSRWRALLWAYIGFTFFSLCWGTLYLKRPFPMPFSDTRFVDWRNYASMLFILFLVASAVETTKQMKILVAIMGVMILYFDRGFLTDAIGRDYSYYTDDLRKGGALGYAGINGLAAFMAQAVVFFLAILGYIKWRYRLLALAVAGGSLLCVMYAFSRAGYVAVVVGCLVLLALRYRKFIPVVIVLGLCASTILPKAVQQRVFMTTDNAGGELDHSSEVRVSLWEEALQEVSVNPVFGLGFNTYAYMDHISGYKDSHNIYVKVLVETGIVGLILFLILLFKSANAGYQLFRIADEPFHAALGLGLAAWVASAIISNFFGDRFTYLEVNGYMWLICGLVARAFLLEKERAENETQAEEENIPAPAISGQSTSEPSKEWSHA